MKKIINGKRYDTDTATKVAHWYGYSQKDFQKNDFQLCIKDLYVTKSRKWFIAGEGLTPISEDEAQNLLERHDFIDALEKYFSNKIEEA